MIIGTKRKIDALGRIVIPHDLKKAYGIGNEVILTQTEQGILITNPSSEAAEK